MGGAAGGEYVGRALRRVEDGRFLRGRARYLDDLRPPGVTFVAFLRSPYAHARIGRLDISGARAQAGVVEILTGDQVRHLGRLPIIEMIPNVAVPPHAILAADVVAAVGEPMVAVVADDAYRARDAVDAIEVEYEQLPAVVSADRALSPQSPILHGELKTNRALDHTWRGGDAASAFREAGHIVRLRVAQNRVAAVPMEPRGVLAEFDESTETLTVWSSTQTPFLLRADLAQVLGFPENRLRVMVPEVGGAFGVKGGTYREEVVVAFLALRLRRPVKWVATRMEDMQTTQHGRGAVSEAEVAVTLDGTVTGLRATIVSNLGAQLMSTAAIPPTRHAVLLPGPYAIPTTEIQTLGALTNTASTGAYRGAGRPEAAFLIERLMDEIARLLKMDPVEIRRRNLIPAGRFPYRTATGQVYDSGEYERALDRALGLAGYPQLRRRQAIAREQGELAGIGMAVYVEPSALGWESGRVRVERGGTVTVTTGACSHGQGHETAFAQILADCLRVSPSDVTIHYGVTDNAPQGMGTYGSRSISLGGGALVLAARELCDKGRQLAAVLLEASSADVDVISGGFQVKGFPDRQVSWREVAERAYQGVGLPDGIEPGLEATVFFRAPREAFSFGCCVAVVRVETETGIIHLEQLVMVDDCGNVINPLLVEGQLHGALAQGIGQALLEQVAYDAHGQLLTGTLMEYAIPRADDMPPIVLDRTTTPSPLNPLGTKGVGEAGTIAAPPAIVNAVVDALAPFGVRHLDMPLTPEKVWRALRGRT